MLLVDAEQLTKWENLRELRPPAPGPPGSAFGTGRGIVRHSPKEASPKPGAPVVR